MTTLLEEKRTLTQTAFRKPDYEVMVHPEGVQINVHLPGVAKQDIELTLKNNILYLNANKSKPASNNYRLIHKEIPAMDYQLSLRVNNKLDMDSLRAQYKDGILEINLTNSKERKSKSIRVS